MIINCGQIKNKYKCNKQIANYLIYELNFPLLAIDGKDYYFTDNEPLQESLQLLPWWLKIIKNF